MLHRWLLFNKHFGYNLQRSPVNVRKARAFATEAPIPAVNRPIAAKKLPNGPNLKEFLIAGKNLPVRGAAENVPYLNDEDFNGHGRKVYFEVYGCQMNVNDTEVVWAILKEHGYVKVDSLAEANVVLVITCAIREGAETRVSKLVS